MKISAEVREQAADLCAVCASTPLIYLAEAERHLLDTNTIDPDHPWSVASCAFSAALDGGYDVSDRLAYAEAEARLRTGWTP